MRRRTEDNHRAAEFLEERIERLQNSRLSGVLKIAGLGLIFPAVMGSLVGLIGYVRPEKLAPGETALTNGLYTGLTVLAVEIIGYIGGKILEADCGL